MTNEELEKRVELLEKEVVLMEKIIGLTEEYAKLLQMCEDFKRTTPYREPYIEPYNPYSPSMPFPQSPWYVRTTSTTGYMDEDKKWSDSSDDK